MVNQVTRRGKAAVVCVTSLNPRAGALGAKSVESTLQLLEQALIDWKIDDKETPNA